MSKVIARDTCRKDVFGNGFCLFVCYEAGRDALFELCERLNSDPLSRDVIFDKTDFLGTHFLLYLGNHGVAVEVFQKHFDDFVKRIDEINWNENKDRLPNLHRPCRFRREDILPSGTLCNLQVFRS
jgi:hypothetical protein